MMESATLGNDLAKVQIGEMATSTYIYRETTPLSKPITIDQAS